MSFWVRDYYFDIALEFFPYHNQSQATKICKTN